MVEFLPLDLAVHRDEFLKLNYETLAWHFKQLKSLYDFDPYPYTGKTPIEIAEASIETYRDVKPPKGIVYLTQVDEEIAGMGALRKLDNGLGEIKRMYNRPSFRGRGLGKLMVRKLLDKGKEFGCTGFGLSTPKFAYAAHHVYKSAGFEDVDFIDGIEIAEWVAPYYLLMYKDASSLI
jgi:GNAT superfamily N-acetyltransferase